MRSKYRSVYFIFREQLFSAFQSLRSGEEGVAFTFLTLSRLRFQFASRLHCSRVYVLLPLTFFPFREMTGKVGRTSLCPADDRYL